MYPARSRSSSAGFSAVLFVAVLARRATPLAVAICVTSTFSRGLARGAPVGHSGVLALGFELDPGATARAGPPGAAVDGAPAVAGKAAGVAAAKVGPHGRAHRLEQLPKAGVGEAARGRPGIDPLPPQRLAAVDVADAGHHALVEKDVADRPGVDAPGILERVVGGPTFGEDVRPKVAERRLLVPDQIDDRRREAQR